MIRTKEDVDGYVEALYADDLEQTLPPMEYIALATSGVRDDEPRLPMFLLDAARMYEAGWSVFDAKWMFLAQSPELSADERLACMDAIETKYRPCPRCGRLGFEPARSLCSYCCGSPGCEVCS